MNLHYIVLTSLFLGHLPAEGTRSSSSLLRPPRELAIRENTCIGSSMSVGKLLRVDEAICNNNVQFGIFAYDEGDATDYRLELRREGKLVESLDRISTDGRAPFVFLQHDGHLLFGDNRGYSQCVVVPGRDSTKNRLRLNVANGEIELKITDVEGDVVWKYDETGGESACYPNLKETCYDTLETNTRITWNEYLCLYDNLGQVKYKYGLDATGLLGLWLYGRLVYRPKGDTWLRGDYFHFQDDGHLTLYEYDRFYKQKKVTLDKQKKILWTSDGCIDTTATKMVMTSDGDVQELNEQGGIVWSLLGSQWNGNSNGNDARDTVPELCHPGQSMSN